MFYSQFILAKKGPLGTIWIAAHLDRKLRKNQVNETNISTSVDSILFPEVPIALRLSGHLLLGVVRIYSRKVNYLFQDCNDALHKLKSAFTAATSTAAASIDLPPDVATAPFHSITLPDETFELSELDLGVVLYKPDGSDDHDHHVTTRDQITLEEPVQEDVPQFDQEERFAATPHAMDIENENFPSSSHILSPNLQEDVLPPMDVDTGPPSSFEAGSIEKLRSVPDVLEDVREFEKQEDMLPQPDLVVNVPIQVGIHVEDNHLVEDEQPFPSTPSTRSSPEQGVVGSDATPVLAVVDTPELGRRKATSRKRKPTVDAQSTLTESYMKDMLKDSSDLRRVRRKIGDAPDYVWMFEKERLGKRMFSKPSLHGLCSGLEELYDQAFNMKRQKTSATTANVTFDQTPASPDRTPQVPGSPAAVPNTPKSPEQVPITPNQQLRDRTPQQLHEAGTPEFLRDQNVFRNVADETPGGQDFGVMYEDSAASLEIRSKRRSDPLAEADHATNKDSPAPELVVEQNSPVEAALASSILDEAVAEGSDTTEGWSGRTRAIAQFLRATFEKEPHKDKVWVEGLLRGKKRKEAARLFFETLVLRSNDYISVDQAGPYEDMSIIARPKLLKAVF